MNHIYNQTIKHLSRPLLFMGLFSLTSCNHGNQLSMRKTIIPLNPSEVIETYKEDSNSNRSHACVSK